MMRQAPLRTSALSALTVPAAALVLAASPAHARPHKIEIGIGAAGLMNGTFMSTIPDEKKVLEYEGEAVGGLTYPGFWGLGGGGGVQLNAMYRGAIGMELDMLYSHDSGTGKITVDGFDYHVTLSQGAFHIPLLVKAAIPLKTVRPFLLLGPEFVLPGDPEAEKDSDAVKTKYTATADAYINLQAGFGFEFILPVEGVDLRIPLSLRYSGNFGVGDNLSDRMTITDAEWVGAGNNRGLLQKEVDYKSEWQHQAFITLGVSWYQYVD